MSTVLVYGDSVTWGIVPDTRRRLPFEERWPGVLEKGLAQRGLPVRVVEDCLNGRRTAFDDPYKPGRNGLRGVGQVIEAQAPLDLVLVMLGTNDFQSTHRNNAWHSGQGVAAVVRAIRQAPVEPGMRVPPVLVLSPPPFDNPRGPIGPKFAGAEHAARGLSHEIRLVCEDLRCHYFEVGKVTGSSSVDGVHLDVDQHAALGRALVTPLEALLRPERHEKGVL